MPQFDAKLFNGEVFQKYVDRIPNVHLNAFIKSGAIVGRPELASAMSDQVGGNFLTTPLKGLISGTVPLNYDGVTDIESVNTQTFSHSRVVVGRAAAWTEKDFSYDITGGVDFMQNVAEQVSEYWDEIDQEMLVAILKGVFSMSSAAGSAFAQKHTHDVRAVQNSEGVTGFMDATTLNTAMQKACGDHKSKFSMTIMHSAVATHLENLKVLTYLKYNDAQGIERELNIGTLNGRMVLVDDDMPVADVYDTAGVYTVTLAGSNASEGDKFTVAGTTYTVEAGDTKTPTGVATSLYTALSSDATYSVSRDGAVLTLTEKAGKYGSGQPAVSTTSATTTITAATTTAPTGHKEYTTFVLGQGAIEYTNCGAKVPYSMARDEKTNGGQDTLYSRQRKCFAPYGISFVGIDNIATLSPTNAELSTGSNWDLVSSGSSYIDDKAIPIAQIISLG